MSSSPRCPKVSGSSVTTVGFSPDGSSTEWSSGEEQGKHTYSCIYLEACADHRLRPGAGYDPIDIPACTARNIRVSNTPTAVDDSTADLTIWLLLGALRKLPAAMATLRTGEWQGPSPPLGNDPQGKVLGILGMGGIGRNVARKARAFGMHVRYHNRSRLGPELEDGAEYVSFGTLLKESDVLSLNLPLNVSHLPTQSNTGHD